MKKIYEDVLDEEELELYNTIEVNDKEQLLINDYKILTIREKRMLSRIKNLKQQGYTIICITNLADEILLADRTLVLEQGKIALEIKREELVEKAEELRKYEIKLPTILEILVELQKNGIQVNAKDYTIPELVNYLVTAKAGGSK